MNDPIATIKSFDQDGFYRTGDIARQEGDVFFIEGRVSIDSKLL
jgi:malonyl-CoA/methylmalonyl-CoA synthetase